nr:MAG TPA: hypothetical protein [Caudoviricetes sp.]
MRYIGLTTFVPLFMELNQEHLSSAYSHILYAI